MENNKLREALETLVEVVEAWKDHLPPAIRDGELSEALEKSNSALSAPRRNCDKYATLEEAEKAYGNTPHLGAADDDPDGPKEYIIPFKRWLFDPVADTGAVS